jgi:hypothetical protein
MFFKPALGYNERSPDGAPCANPGRASRSLYVESTNRLKANASLNAVGELLRLNFGLDT